MPDFSNFNWSKNNTQVIRKFIKIESLGGILLFAAAIAAIIMDNSRFTDLYDKLLDSVLLIRFGEHTFGKPLILWINEGLMAIYFLMVGLEIKREVLKGVLQSRRKLALPAVGAIGGIAFPAAIYCFFNWGNEMAVHGWAIPAATDIAFSLGILSLLGKRVPISLKVFLTALAILDDIAAVLIIAIFYTADLSLTSLVVAGALIFTLFLMNKIGITRIAPYIIVGILLWLSVLNSGVHATLAGIIIAFSIPLETENEEESKDKRSPLLKLEETLHPWITFLVLPIFAFANAGFSFHGLTIESLMSPIPLGIACGLFFGKQFGIFGSVWLFVKSGIGSLPHQMNWVNLYGVTLLCGVGFTMSLFIGTLAFEGFGFEYATMTKLGVVAGSVLSGVFGFLLLRFCKCPESEVDETSMKH